MATWKAVERKVASILGGKRVVSGKGSNEQDVEHDLFSVEVKHRKNMPQIVRDSFAQCVRNAPEGKLPLLVLHQKGSSTYMAVMDLQQLVELLGKAKPEINENT